MITRVVPGCFVPLLRNRKHYRKCRPFLQAAGYGDFPLMLFYDRPGYGKPQAISAFFSHPRFVRAVKPFEDMLLIGRRDRLSRIIDGQHCVMGGGLQGDGDRSADAGVFALSRRIVTTCLIWGSLPQMWMPGTMSLFKVTLFSNATDSKSRTQFSTLSL